MMGPVSTLALFVLLGVMLPPRRNRGDTISHQDWTALRDFAASLVIRIDPHSRLTLSSTPNGQMLGDRVGDVINIKITARSGNNYAWTLQRPKAGGLWIDFPFDAPKAGTLTIDPAHERNAVVAATPAVVEARRVPGTNELIFDRDTC